jgi:hypothetical protein
LKKFDLQIFFKSLSAGLTNQPYMAYSTCDNPLTWHTGDMKGSYFMLNSSTYFISLCNLEASLEACKRSGMVRVEAASPTLHFAEATAEA